VETDPGGQLPFLETRGLEVKPDFPLSFEPLISRILLHSPSVLICLLIILDNVIKQKVAANLVDAALLGTTRRICSIDHTPK